MSARTKAVHDIGWLGPLKGLAILWVFLNHFSERVFGSPYISNPNADWPPIADRLAQLAPIGIASPLENVALNLVRYLGWAGDQGVQLFLIASGFGLMWSVQQRSQVESYRSFLSRRMWRIYPLWWGVHLLFLLLSLFVGRYGMQPLDPKFYFSMIGFRATPELIYYFAPAWWYVGLILQFYLVFPLLARWLRRVGAVRFLLWTLGLSLLIRLVGLYAFDGYLDAWSRGAIFVTRLPEFAVGMALAWAMFDRPAAVDRVLNSPAAVAAAVVGYMVATACALTLLGMAVAPLFHGVAAFVMAYGVIWQLRTHVPAVTSVLSWLGGISYSLYLTHHPVTAFLVDRKASPTVLDIALGLPVFAVAVVVALLLEWAVGRAETLLVERVRRNGATWVVVRVAVAAGVATALLVGAEVTVRHLEPQEAYGWGERPSLQPHPVFGWNLIPESTTRLRWESYDYVLVANELGFPGPSYLEHRSPGSLRIMTLGDAFTSAEGVDTNDAWPRVLEVLLRDRLSDVRVEVLNFAVTGYGPNEYASVFAEFGPRYRPDLVLIGFFVNDFFDVSVSAEAFQADIGFGLPPQNSVVSYLTASQTRVLLQHRITDPIREALTGTPRSYGYFLGNFRAFELNDGNELLQGAQQVRRRLAEIKSEASAVGARVVVVLIPASIQVCEPDDLEYYPDVVDLDNTERFLLDRPQSLALEIAEDLGFATVDLRTPLLALDACPYQRWNMHWMPEGHRAAAATVADTLFREGFIADLPATEDGR